MRTKIIGLLLLIFGCLFFNSCHFVNYNKIEYSEYDSKDSYQTGNFEYNREEIKKIELNWYSSSVDIIKKDDASLKVYEHSDDIEDDKKIHYLNDGDTLKIQFCASGYTGQFTELSKKLTLEIGTEVSLEINSISADIKSDYLNVEELDFHSISGDLDIKKLLTTKLNISTVSGDVELNYLGQPDYLDALASPSVKIEVVSGDVEMIVYACSSIEIKGTSSDVELTLVASLGATVKYESTSGKFKGEGAYKVEEDVKIFGDGKCPITVNTISGDCKIISK